MTDRSPSSARPFDRAPSVSPRCGVVGHAPKIGTIRKCSTPAPRAVLSLALGQAMRACDATPADVGYWCDVDEKTVRRWLTGESPVRVEAVMRSKRLWPVFWEAMQAETLERRVG